MKKLSLLYVSIALLSMHIQLFAAENSSPNAEMDRLITAEQHQEAFDLGTANLEEWEGDPEFDFLYGLAALESGNPNEGVFALERVAATATDGVLRERARLELARAYFVTNNLTASENLFNLVLTNDPPGNVAQNIEAFLLLIETRREAQLESNISWTVSSFIGSDSNVNSATTIGTIDTPVFGDIELDPSGQQIEDQFSNTRAEMEYRYMFTRDRFISAGVDFTHLNNFETDQFDIDILKGSVEYNWGSNVDRFTVGTSATNVILDNNGFQDSIAANASWQHAAANAWFYSLSGSYTQARYDTSNGQDTNDLRDIDQFLLTTGVTKVNGGFTHSANLYWADEDPQDKDAGEHNGREFWGLAYSLLYQLTPEHLPYLRLSYQEVEHDAHHPVFLRTTRHDDIESATAGWFYQWNRNLTVNGEATYSEDVSNIPLFDHNRFKFQAGFRYRF